MAAPRNPVENARRLAQLLQPHVVILGFPGECLACRVDGWARRARFAARAGYTYAALAQLMLAPNGARLVQPERHIAVVLRHRGAATRLEAGQLVLT